MKVIINKMFSKKVFLRTSLFILGYFILVVILSFMGMKEEVMQKTLGYPFYVIGNYIDALYIVILLLVLSISSVVISFLSDRIFEAWRLWTGIWFIPFITLIYLATTVHGSGGLDAGPSYKGAEFILMFVIYVVISITVILTTFWKEKHNK